MTTDLSVDRDAVLAALRQVHYPGRSRDIVSFGLVPHVAACDGLVKLTLAIAHLDDERQQMIAAASVDAVRSLPGVRDITLAADDWEIFFAQVGPAAAHASAEAADAAPARTITLDYRGLQPPQPMLRVWPRWTPAARTIRSSR